MRKRKTATKRAEAYSLSALKRRLERLELRLNNEKRNYPKWGSDSTDVFLIGRKDHEIAVLPPIAADRALGADWKGRDSVPVSDLLHRTGLATLLTEATVVELTRYQAHFGAVMFANELYQRL